jgi:hypothetical protein
MKADRDIKNQEEKLKKGKGQQESHEGKLIRKTKANITENRQTTDEIRKD